MRILFAIVLCLVVLFSSIQILSSVATAVSHSGPQDWVTVQTVRPPEQRLDTHTVEMIHNGYNHFGGTTGEAVSVINEATVEITVNVNFYKGHADASPEHALWTYPNSTAKLKPGEVKYFFPTYAVSLTPSGSVGNQLIGPMTLFDWSVSKDGPIVEMFNGSDHAVVGVPPGATKVFVPPPNNNPPRKGGVLAYVILDVLAIAGLPFIWFWRKGSQGETSMSTKGAGGIESIGDSNQKLSDVSSSQQGTAPEDMRREVKKTRIEQVQDSATHESKGRESQKSRQLLARAKALLEENKWDASLAVYEQVIQIGNDAAEGFYGVGLIRFTLGDLESAARQFENCLRINGQNANALYYLGEIAEKQNRVDVAVANYRKAIEVKPDHAGALRKLKALQGNTENIPPPASPKPRTEDPQPAKVQSYGFYDLIRRDQTPLDG